MLQTLRKFFAFCGAENRKMFITSIWLGVVSAICSAMRIPAAAIVIQALLNQNVTMETLWTSLGMIVISLIITIIINMRATMLQTRAGYRACANKRIEIAEHLRYLPMGWFNDNSLGEVTAVTTNTMENMANIATRVVMVTTRGFLTSGIIAVMLLLFNWRMGRITLAGLVLFFTINAAMQRAEQTLAQRKCNAEVKNFDLTRSSTTQVHNAVEEARKASFAMEIPDVSLTIPEKTTVAIVGPSGSGKTTLCNLMARFWDVQSGSVSLGGRYVREYSYDSLIRNFSFVFQRTYLFSDTIANNIRFGRPDATLDEVKIAAKKARCCDFIMALPDGFDTVIGEGGATLSGGERQRISIARAIMKNTPIIILDEATTNVDPENEKELMEAVSELTHDKTVIMIAHRLKTVQNADMIFAVDHGKIVQQSTHDELVAADGLYRRFVVERKQAAKWKV